MNLIKLKLLCLTLVAGVSFSEAQDDDYYYEDFAGFYRAYPELGGDISLLVRIMRKKSETYYTEFKIFAYEEGLYYINFYIMCPRLADGTYAIYDVSVNDIYYGKVTTEASNWQAAGLLNNEKVELKKGLNIISIDGGKMINNMGGCPWIEFVRLSTDEERAKISTITSNSNIQTIGVNVYPNPASVYSFVNVKADEAIEQIVVYDLSGQKLQRFAINENQVKLSLFDMNLSHPGIYIVKIKTVSGIRTEKLIVH